MIIGYFITEKRIFGSNICDQNQMYTLKWLDGQLKDIRNTIYDLAYVFLNWKYTILGDFEGLKHGHSV